MIEPSPVSRTRSELDERFAAVVDEISRKLQASEPVDVEEYARQNPDCAERLRRLLPAMQSLVELGLSPSRTSQGEVRLAPLPHPPSGVLGDFRILREIGRGGMGVVYEAEQISLHRRVALKMLPFAAVLDPKQLQRFQNEALAAASLKHPGIVQVYAVGCERGVHYYAMEYVEGRTLAEVIGQLREERAGSGRPADSVITPSPPHRVTPSLPHPVTPSPVHPLTPSQAPAETQRDPQAAVSTKPSHQTSEFFRSAAQLGIQAAEALEHAHQLGVVHRDIKPSNLMVQSLPSPSGRGAGGEGLHLWITDFGLAQITAPSPLGAEGQGGGAALTLTGDVLGTLRYMSPEQAQGKRSEMDHRTDIYSLGVTLYELLTLQPAFAGDNRQTLVRRLLEDEPPPPRSISGSVPRDLETIVLKATAKEPAQRYGTAQELADDLKRFLTDEPIRARRPSLGERARRWSRHHRTIVCSTAAAVFVVMAVLAVSAILLFGAYEGEKQQRGLAEANAVKAQENATKAEKNYETARRAVQQMLIRVAEEQVGAIPEMKEVQKRLLEDAAAFYTELINLNPRDGQAYVERAEVHEKLGKFAETLRDLEKAVEIDPQSASFHDELARRLTWIADPAYRDLHRALVHAKRAAELDPENIVHRIRLFVAYHRLGFPDEARAELEKASKLKCDSPWAYFDLADAQGNIGDLAGALASARKAVELDPNVPNFHWRLANFLLASGDEERALDAINKAIAVNRNRQAITAHGWYSFRADIYLRRQMYATALADYDKSIQLAPFWSYTYKRRAVAHFQLKNYEKALADIAKAVELNPDDYSNLVWLGTEALAKCPDQRLRKGLMELADKVVQGSKGAAGAYSARARLHGAVGDPQKALADFAKSLELEPKNGDLWKRRARYYAQHDQPEKALADFAKSIELEPKDAETWRWRGECYAQGLIDPCLANEQNYVNMRTVWYETERKRSRIGGPPTPRREAPPGRGRCRRGRGNRCCFPVFGETMASGRAERRSGGFPSQTPSRPQAPSEPEAEAATAKDSLGRPAEGGVPDRALDLPPGGRSGGQEVSRRVSPRSRGEDPPSPGLDLPEARTTGARTGPGRGGAVAEAGLAADKKGAKRRGSPIVFLDESGFMLQPVRRCTWAPSGQTPIQDAWDRHDRLSAVGLISVSPRRHRLSLYFQLLPENVDTDHMVWLLRLLHDHYRRHVILVWDRWNVHESATAYFEKRHPDWFTFEPLPSYSPELNPVEQCWNHTKHADLANFIPDDLDDLEEAVGASIADQSKDQNLLRSFFVYAKLPL